MPDESSPQGAGPPSAADRELILARLGPLRDELPGARIFITGGTGFFGRWLLEALACVSAALDPRAEAVVLTRDPAGFRARAPRLAAAPWLRLVTGEVDTFAPPSGGFTHVIHAAGTLNRPQGGDAAREIDVVCRGTRRVLELARERGVRRFLFTSSGAVYGPGRTDHPVEDAPLPDLPVSPRHAYAIAKRAAERECMEAGAAHGIAVTIARGFAFLGAHLPRGSHLAAAMFLEAAARGEPLIVQGDGRAVRSYLYGADLAVWLWTILLRGAPGGVFNVGSDVPVTLLELARAVSSAAAVPPEVRVLGGSRPDGVTDVYVPDIRRARCELGLDVFTPLAEGIRRTLSP